MQPQPILVNTNELAGYEPQLLATQELLNIYWPQTAELLAPVVTNVMHGEMTLEDIYNAVMAGTMYCFVFKDDAGEAPTVALTLVLEVSNYPRFSAMNIIAIGGTPLNLFRSRFWEHICGWAYMNGARKVEASVVPTMVASMQKFGFEPTYTMVRLDL